MKKILFVLLTLMLCNIASAELVEPYTTVELPQLTPIREIDTSGVWQTYLYCTWHIGDEGVVLEEMTINKCPQNQTYYEFDDDETYFVRIDYATLNYNEISGWGIANRGKDSDMQIDYELDIPPPPQSIFDDIIDFFMDIINNILCNMFGIYCA